MTILEIRKAIRNVAGVAASIALLFTAVVISALAQDADVSRAKRQATSLPPRVAQTQRFLVQRGWGTNRAGVRAARIRTATAKPGPASVANNSTAIWQPLGPQAVSSANYGLVTGRVSSIALDPADSTGNRVYLGTTGGGVWVSQNAGASDISAIVFSPLMDTLAALSGARDASISIGALTVQPGGTGVILAGTGDPNDALDSYYGAGILRSADGGGSWNLIPVTADQRFAFTGEGFAGFAWSTVNPQVVVAAVSQAYEGTLANAERPNVSYAGLYYSSDSGTTWSLARITDGNGVDVQGPLDPFALPNGNAATTVVWNPVRRLLFAAVRFHGYYQSADGVTWARMTAQPGAGLTSQICPTNRGSLGSIACPIFRGALAVNPLSGDLFAWTVDVDNQDQGIWQDQCAISGGSCSNQTVAFQKQWNASALETNAAQGAATIANGDYNLALAAVPLAQDTLLLAGANDLWKCSLAMGCTWRNTTNSGTCMSAQVAGYQHALEWNTANSLEVFLGNDSGLWRSMDAIGETGPVCAASDAAHFQNINGGMGSLAEVMSMSEVTAFPYSIMTGLGVNGTAGVKSTSGPTAVWPEILGGEGGPVAIDPTNNANWYVNNQAGVSIHRCSQSGDCNAADFGVSPVVSNADVSGDGYTMTTPAPFLVDPLDATQLLVGTCRVWRGPADGSGWSGTNAISPILDGVRGNSYCNGDALIRTMTAMPLAGGGEVIYVGMYGAASGGAILAGHVLKATFDLMVGGMPVWQDLTLNPVNNDSQSLNFYGLDISSVYIDPHDATGNTVYVTVAGFPNPVEDVRVVYRSTDGGANWAFVTSNLPGVPANSVVVDPQDANTVYIATDYGVFSTRQIGTCTVLASSCWSRYGTGLPQAPVVQLSAASTTGSLSVLAAATYGRGVWQIPLWTAGTQLTAATVAPESLTFGAQAYGTKSSAQTVTLTNSGGIALMPTAVAVSGDFSETDKCVNASINAGASCAIQVSFTPTQTGSRIGQLVVSANVAGGQLSVALSGTSSSTSLVNLTPGTVDFGQVQVETSSTALQVTAENGSGVMVPISSVNVTAPFVLASNGCGSSLAANSDCQLMVQFAPTQAGAASGTLTLVDGAGTQSVALSGMGAARATDSLAPGALSFPATIAGQLSTAKSVVLTNDGDLPLNSISVSVSVGFQTSNNCSTMLVAHASCSINVIFAPTQVGSQSGTLSVADAVRTQFVALSGTGLQPPAIGVNPAQLGFSTQPVGVSSAPLTLTVSNTGGAPIENVGFQITGSAAGSFLTGATTCGATLGKGSGCTMQVVFKPAAAGVNMATLIVSSSTLGVNAVPVPMSGVGQAASGLTVSPGQFAFTVARIGQASAAQTATIKNTSNGTAGALALSVTGPFSLVQNTCGASLAAGASCTTGVVFTPTGDGVVTGTLTAGSTAFANPGIAGLSGTGGAVGSVLMLPALLNFSPTGVGTVSGTQNVTVTNSSAVTLTNLVLSASSEFRLSSTTCGMTLASGMSCAAAVAFAPSGAGQQSGNLTIASNTMAANAQAPLSGMGVDFSASLAGGTSQTVASGQTARYTLQLSPMNGSAGTFTFECGSLPANAVCIFNPTSETVAANSTGSATVQIATGQSMTSAQLGRPASASGGWRVLPLLCGLLLVPLSWCRKRGALSLMALFAVVVVGLTSCAGSGGGTGGAPPSTSTGLVTPAGTYSIPVSISASGVTHKVTVSLTVD